MPKSNYEATLDPDFSEIVVASGIFLFFIQPYKIRLEFHRDSQQGRRIV